MPAQVMVTSRRCAMPGPYPPSGAGRDAAGRAGRRFGPGGGEAGGALDEFLVGAVVAEAEVVVAAGGGGEGAGGDRHTVAHGPGGEGGGVGAAREADPQRQAAGRRLEGAARDGLDEQGGEAGRRRLERPPAGGDQLVVVVEELEGQQLGGDAAAEIAA